MSIELEVTTERFSLTLRTDVVGYNPSVAADRIDRLLDARLRLCPTS